MIQVMNFLQRFGAQQSRTAVSSPSPQGVINGTANHSDEISEATIVEPASVDPRIEEKGLERQRSADLVPASAALGGFTDGRVEYKEFIRDTWDVLGPFGQPTLDEQGNAVSTKIDPFAPIQVEQLGGQSTGAMNRYSQITVMDPVHEDHVRHTSKPCSPNYLVISHREIHEQVQGILDSSPFSFQQFLLYADREQFRKAWVAVDCVVEQGDDKYYLVAMTGNDYGGSMSAFVTLGLLRWACVNLAISGRQLASYKFRHTHNNVDWPAETDRVLGMLSTAREDATRFATGLWNLQDVEINHDHMKELLNKHMLHMPDRIIMPSLRSFYEKEDQSAFALMNSFTGVISHSNFTRSSFGQLEKVTDTFLELVN